MKRFSLFLGAFLCSILSTAQVLTPQQIPCWNLNQADIVGQSNVGAVDCIETDGTVNFLSSFDYSIKAGEHITFSPETHISPNNAHLFHAFIEQPNFDLAWYEPLTAGEVGQFEKLELGLQFDNSINDQILNFIDDQSGNKLNPFNPDEIDIVAQFYYYNGISWEGPVKAFGFYYQEYVRQNTTWDTTSTQHNFRIRFNPRKIGTWRCNVTATINQQNVYQSEMFYF